MGEDKPHEIKIPKIEGDKRCFWCDKHAICLQIKTANRATIQKGWYCRECAEIMTKALK